MFSKGNSPYNIINARSACIYIFLNGDEIQFPLDVNSLSSSYQISLLALGVIIRQTKKKDWYSELEKKF